MTTCYSNRKLANIKAEGILGATQLHKHDKCHLRLETLTDILCTKGFTLRF